MLLTCYSSCFYNNKVFNFILVPKTAETLVCCYDGELPIHVRPIDDVDLENFGCRLPGYHQTKYVALNPFSFCLNFYGLIYSQIFRSLLAPLGRSHRDKRGQVREVLKFFQLRPPLGYFAGCTGQGANKSKSTKFLKKYLGVVDCSSTSTPDCFVVKYCSDLDPWSNKSIMYWLDGQIHVRKTPAPPLIPPVKQEFIDNYTPGRDDTKVLLN